MTELSPLVQAQQNFANAISFASLPSEIVTLELALNRILADDIKAPADAPPYARAIVEGYLVRTEDTRDASEQQPKAFRIIGQTNPGDRQCVSPGKNEGVQVATGSIVPEGPFSIVRQWEAKVDSQGFTISRGFPPRFFVEEQGCDVKKGTAVLAKGRLIEAWDIGVLASLGMAHVNVVRKPRVAIFGSGNEVIPHTSGFIPGAIFDCNSPMLAAAVTAAGGQAILGGVQRDDFDAFVAAVQKALVYADMVVIAGGTAIGGRDFISDLVRKVGQLVIDGVPMKSGRPLIMGVAGNKPLVGVAGHPPEALRGFQMFGVLAMNRLLGREMPLPVDVANTGNS